MPVGLIHSIRSRTWRPFLFAGALAVPYYPAPAQVPLRVAFDSTIELATFDSVWTRIRDTYYDPEMRGLDWNRVRDELRPEMALARSREQGRAVIGRMLERIGDSHFALVPNGDSAASGGAAAGDRPGDVGLELRLIGRRYVVVHVDSGGPAAGAGVRPGWILDRVDTSSAVAMLADTSGTAAARRTAGVRSLLTAIRRLQGAPGSVVRLAFLDGRNRPVTLSVVRREARGEIVRLGQLPPIPTWLEWRRIESAHGCVGVIRFNTWMTAVAAAFEDAVHSLRACSGIILDLRGNVGGVGAMVVGFTGHFVDRELLLGTLKTRTSELRYVANPRRVRRDGTRVEPYTGSLALVVDELSASTTEIFVAALQHHGRARVFGRTTAGQALPSLMMPLPNGDGLLYAIADLTDPGGRRLEGKGIIPDEVVPLSRDALLAGSDEPVAAALRWIGRAGHGSLR